MDYFAFLYYFKLFRRLKWNVICSYSKMYVTRMVQNLHQKMIHHNHTTCPLCREDIQLTKRLERQNMDWLVHGGAPCMANQT